MPRTLLTFGAGPGIGNHVSSLLASRGGIDHVVLLARNTSRLESSDAPFVRAAAPRARVDVLSVDLSDLEALPGVLGKLDELIKGDEVEVVFFNAAVIEPTEEVLGAGVEVLERDLRTTTLSLYLVAQHYFPRLQSLSSTPNRHPALIVTNSHLPWDPVPQLLSLSLVKAAQRTMVLGLHRAYQDKGVHCGLITVQGQVAPENKVLSPQKIAEAVFEFWGEGKGEEVRLKEE